MSLGSPVYSEHLEGTGSNPKSSAELSNAPRIGIFPPPLPFLGSRVFGVFPPRLPFLWSLVDKLPGVLPCQETSGSCLKQEPLELQ